MSKKKKLLISIIIPYYKKKKFILQTLKSVIKQTFKNFEVIIIYDDSDLSDYYFIKNFIKGKKRIKIYRPYPFQIGVSKARNFGIKKSRGSYLAFIDSDDLWKKNKLGVQLKTMLNSNALISHTSYSLIDENNKIIGLMRAQKKLNYDNLLTSCDIGLSTVMINSSIKSQIKFPNVKTKEDYILWLKLSKKINILGIKRNLGSWRKLKSSLSSSIIQRLKDAFIVYYTYEKFTLIKSIIYVLILSLNFFKKRLMQKLNR